MENTDLVLALGKLAISPRKNNCTHGSQLNWIIALFYTLVSPIMLGKWRTMF